MTQSDHGARAQAINFPRSVARFVFEPSLIIRTLQDDELQRFYKRTVQAVKAVEDAMVKARLLIATDKGPFPDFWRTKLDTINEENIGALELEFELLPASGQSLDYYRRYLALREAAVEITRTSLSQTADKVRDHLNAIKSAAVRAV